MLSLIILTQGALPQVPMLGCSEALVSRPKLGCHGANYDHPTPTRLLRNLRVRSHLQALQVPRPSSAHPRGNGHKLWPKLEARRRSTPAMWCSTVALHTWCSRKPRPPPHQRPKGPRRPSEHEKQCKTVCPAVCMHTEQMRPFSFVESLS